VAKQVRVERETAAQAMEDVDFGRRLLAGHHGPFGREE